MLDNSDDEHENGSTASGQLKESSPLHDTDSRASIASDDHDAANSASEHHDGINISHEDLSDVSDLESATASPAPFDKDAEAKASAAPVADLRQKINEKKSQQKAIDDKSTDGRSHKQSPSIVDELNDINKKHKNDEDALDFEAEDGECADEKDDGPLETSQKSEGKDISIGLRHNLVQSFSKSSKSSESCWCAQRKKTRTANWRRAKSSKRAK